MSIMKPHRIIDIPDSGFLYFQHNTTDSLSQQHNSTNMYVMNQLSWQKRENEQVNKNKMSVLSDTLSSCAKLIQFNRIRAYFNV